MKLTIFISIFLIIFEYTAFCENVVQIGEIISETSYKPKNIEFSGSKILCIDKKYIEDSNAENIPQILNTLSSFNIIEKGTPGSQTDLSVRGSTFENVLIMINGIPIHDSQTGHFLMDLPIDISDIEKIEIVTGGASAFFGSSSSGGAINIVTEKDKKGISFSLNTGSYNSKNLNFSGTRKLGLFNITLSAANKTSDGYEDGLDLNENNYSFLSNFSKNNLIMNFVSGFSRKKFGAKNFYSNYPSFEKTDTFFSGLNTSYIINKKNILKVDIGGRGHSDDFILLRNNPAFYHNTHYNRSFIGTVELLSEFKNKFHTNIGIQKEITGITSGSLGDHKDYQNAIYTIIGKDFSCISASTSFRINKNARDGYFFLPGIGITIPIKNNLSFRIKTEKAFRTPTYTELFYTSPANISDPDLKSEKTICVETGIDYVRKTENISVSFFNRNVKNTLDWVMNKDKNVWMSVNHGSSLTRGFEADFSKIFLSKLSFNASYSHIDQIVTGKRGTVSKYALNPLNNSVFLNFSFPFLFKTLFVFNTRYEDTEITGDRTISNGSISRNIKFCNVVFSVKNLSNKSYYEIPGLKAPGRWLSIELEYR